LRFGRFDFSPRAVPTLGAVLLIALTLWLGRWQNDRAHEKGELQALLESRSRETAVLLTGSVPTAEPLLYRHVRAVGSWVPEGQVYIDNQVHEGRAGFHVITPLRLSGRAEAVLVNRGWIARNADYPRAPVVPVPAGTVEVSGLAALPPRRFLELSPEVVSGPVWQNLSVDRYRERMKMDVLPVVVLSEAPAPGLVAVREKPDTGMAKHQEYALTWFSLAATTAALWIAMNLRRVR
jgi:surfeit locus 1 family protein